MYGLAKLASEEEQNNTSKVIGGALAGGAVGAGAGKNRITGMETLYHGTGKGNIPSILQDGLQGHRALDGKQTGAVAATSGIPEEELNNKVYLTRKKGYAKINGDFVGMGDGGVVRANVPYEHLRTGVLKEVANPELLGATTKEEFAKRRLTSEITQHWDNPIIREMWEDQLGKNVTLEQAIDFKLKSDPSIQQMYGKLFSGVSAPNTVTIDGDVPTQYLKGSVDYQGQTLKGLSDYIRNNPKRFAGGLGLAGAGTLAGGGLAYLANRPKKEE